MNSRERGLAMGFTDENGERRLPYAHEALAMMQLRDRMQMAAWGQNRDAGGAGLFSGGGGGDDWYGDGGDDDEDDEDEEYGSDSDGEAGMFFSEDEGLPTLQQALLKMQLRDIADTKAIEKMLAEVKRGAEPEEDAEEWECDGFMQELDESLTALQRVAPNVSGAKLRRALRAAPDVIVLSKKQLGAPGAEAVARVLEKMQGLRELWLDWTRVGPEGATSLAPVLGTMTSLQKLSLGRCSMSGAGMAKIAPQLPPSLVYLDLACNISGNEGANALAAHLSRLTNLQHLNLQDNTFGIEGMQKLAPQLKLLTQLKHLDLTGNDMCAAGGHALASVLPSFLSLAELKLGYNGLGGAGAKAIVLKLPCGVQRLSLAYNNFRSEDKRELRSHLPKRLHDFEWE